ncbi:PTS beta-glucoside transporter subunit EIIBCA [Niallia circulans]|uniref:PTS beta-glucoside transporter subunit EIIBCA n=1 Tax=Niallia circulans TaxID=1397 RepID=A0A553SRP9_NIACI|nr:beta-glucoside-specific PTS transporter subunit IIABC [Niallia circulans]TRZ39664.1 PTS beta-glucoside transporter subunit EIIBCA [Niallia circulans]
MSQEKLAKDIVIKIGGKENITRSWHCVTRLRFHVKDESKVDVEGIRKLNGAMGAQFQNGQFQVIVGNKVMEVFKEVESLVGINNESSIGESSASKKKLLSRFFDMISGVFSPVIPAIAGAGMMKGILTLLQVLGWISVESDAYQVLTIISDAAFYFLPFLLAISAAKRFKVSEYLAVALAGALLYPTITAGVASGEAGLKFLGMSVPFIGYSATVIPIIIAVWILSYVYKLINRIVPSTVRVVLTPTLVFLIMIPFTLIVAGPIGFVVGDYVGIAVAWIYEHGGVFAGILIGGLMPVFVVTGMHYGFAPIILQNMGKYGYDNAILPLNIVNSLAQAGAAFAVSFRTKNKKLKSLAVSTGVSALLGVTEPAVFGVNLKLKRPLYATMIAGAISGGMVVYFGVKCFGFILQGLEAFPVYIDPASPMNLVYTIISMIVSFIIAFVMTLILGFEDVPADDEDSTKENKTTSLSHEGEEVGSPLTGKVLPLQGVPDKTFSGEILGKSIAIEPSENTLVSPFTGTVAMIYPTKHAIGLRSENGLEVLIHIGLETVNLEGKFFNVKVEQGQYVQKGQELITFDREAISNEGYNMVTLVILTNSDQYSSVEKLDLDYQVIKTEEQLFNIQK